MIIFDIKCESGHRFEGWFNDSQAFQEQKEKNLVSCPVCNSIKVEIVPSGVTIMGKESRLATESLPKNEVSPAEALRSLHQYIDKNFDDVGNQFAEVALKIHYGEEEKRNIKGTTTSQEEENLRQEGVQFVKIPVLKMDS